MYWKKKRTTLLSLIIGVLGKKCEVGETDLRKSNQGKIIEIPSYLVNTDSRALILI